MNNIIKQNAIERNFYFEYIYLYVSLIDYFSNRLHKTAPNMKKNKRINDNNIFYFEIKK